MANKVNKGEVPQYYVEHSHEPIITPEEFDKVQTELARRKLNLKLTTLFKMCGATVLTLQKPTPIKAFPYFHSVSHKIRCKIRESYFAVLIVRPVRNKKMLPHRFR